MKFLSLFLIFTVVAATCWAERPVDPRSSTFRYVHKFRPSWYIANNVKDAAGCNSSWSSAATVQTLQTNDHRVYINTPPHVKINLKKWSEEEEEEEVPGEWIL